MLPQLQIIEPQTPQIYSSQTSRSQSFKQKLIFKLSPSVKQLNFLKSTEKKTSACTSIQNDQVSGLVLQLQKQLHEIKMAMQDTLVQNQLWNYFQGQLNPVDLYMEIYKLKKIIEENQKDFQLLKNDNNKIESLIQEIRD